MKAAAKGDIVYLKTSMKPALDAEDAKKHAHRKS